jgi:hypothetical protein
MVRLAAAAAALVLLVSACGDDEPQVADDPPSSASATSSPTPSPTPTPTPTPAEGPYPEYPPSDYRFLLAVSCFCPDAGTPIAVTVEDDRVVDAVLAADGTGRGGGKKGDRAPDYLWRSIDDIIAEANRAEAGDAAEVRVRWSTGIEPPYPTEVYIDQSRQMADEEVGYRISDVVNG